MWTDRSCNRCGRQPGSNLEIQRHRIADQDQIVQSAGAISATIQCGDMDDDRRDWPEITCFRDGSPEAYSGNQSMGPAEKCGHTKGSRDQPGCRQPRTLKATFVFWACGLYVAKPHSEHHAIRESTWEKTSGQTKEAMAR